MLHTSVSVRCFGERQNYYLVAIKHHYHHNIPPPIFAMVHLAPFPPCVDAPAIHTNFTSINSFKRALAGFNFTAYCYI